jgi:hypothetical protein
MQGSRHHDLVFTLQLHLQKELLDVQLTIFMCSNMIMKKTMEEHSSLLT